MPRSSLRLGNSRESNSALQPIAPLGLALYIHWPFCLKKCPYCDFNSHVQEDPSEAIYADGLLNELEYAAGALGSRRLQSIFFGGGTPSLMRPEDVARLIAAATRLFPPQGDVEITLEANPTSTEQARLKGFKEAGINRLSLGIQSLDDAALTWLGRQHSAAEALSALDLARSLFQRVSFDLIYARPEQTLAAWTSELTQVLDRVSDHLSLYQLTIEPGTKFESAFRQGKINMLDDAHAAALYDATADVAAQKGLSAYEVSNYAYPGSESRHNLAYWRYEDYLGIGPGAHSRLTLNDQDGITRKYAVRRHRAPAIWLDKVRNAGHGTVENTPLSAQSRAREALLMGLRLKEGIARDRFRATTGQQLEDCIDHTILKAAQDEGYLVNDASALYTTEAGRIRLEALLASLVL